MLEQMSKVEDIGSKRLYFSCMLTKYLLGCNIEEDNFYDHKVEIVAIYYNATSVKEGAGPSHLVPSLEKKVSRIKESMLYDGKNSWVIVQCLLTTSSLKFTFTPDDLPKSHPS
ncbi:hypothetical protein RND71_039648 [Anisodus tanguticus]|uniref:Uncharacterized protein n=1 Tax=Anisodus tanguticus TaxID=243964 RepID=A0AAE1QZZ3_9SOLA|nr:hypothetical protein RND71_039648 [Anisodus tanguticus]